MQVPGQVQRGSGEGSEGSGEGLGGFGAEPGHVQKGSGERVPEKEKVWEALVQSQVRFNRVPEKVPGGFGAGSGEGCGEGVGGFGAARSGSTGFRRRFRRKCGRVWCRARLGLTGFRRRFRRRPKKVPGGFGAEPGQVQQGSGECSGEGLGGFGAEPGQVQQDSCPFNSRKHS